MWAVNTTHLNDTSVECIQKIHCYKLVSILYNNHKYQQASVLIIRIVSHRVNTYKNMYIIRKCNTFQMWTVTLRSHYISLYPQLFIEHLRGSNFNLLSFAMNVIVFGNRGGNSMEESTFKFHV